MRKTAVEELHQFLMSIQEVFPLLQKNSPSPHIDPFNPHRKQGDLHSSVSTQPPDAICRYTKYEKEPARPCYQAWLSFLTVCHSGGGRSARCCIVPLLGIDSNGTIAAIRQQDVKKRIVLRNSSHTHNPDYITIFCDN